MEINLMSFLPILTIRWTTKKLALIYFIVQSVGSIVVLFGGFTSERLSQLTRCVTLGLLLKGSLAPLHFWGAPLVVGLTRVCAYIFLTWQKIVPLFVILTVSSRNFLFGFALLNLLVSVFRGIGSKHVYVLLFFSGLLQAGWLFSTSIKRAAIYFIIYMLILGPVIYSLPHDLPLLIINIGGLPPLTGFFMKLFIMQQLALGMGVLLLRISTFLLYSYIRLFLHDKWKKHVNISSLLVCCFGLVW